MALSAAVEGQSLTLPVLGASLALFTTLFLYLFKQPPLPKNAPALTSEAWPILGSLQFFTQRWDFYQRSMAQSKSGNFSFFAGQRPVVAVAGDEGRKVFMESKGLAFAEGYAALLGGQPTVSASKNPLVADDHGAENGFSAYFNKRLINMLKGNRLAEGLPQMLKDARAMLDELARDPAGITDPFDSIYRMVFKFTMRTVACNEIANDPALLTKTLKLYEDIEHASSPLTIMYPWLPTPAKIKRFYSGSQLYMIFKRVVDARKKEERRESDALQYLIDQGDSITDIITFVLGALFAGQLNSGINAAWILVYLTSQPYWLGRVDDEINTIADRYAPSKDLPLKERLMQVPIEAWEGEFPIIGMCLKDSIRLQMSGNAFRRNTSGGDIHINKTEVIPNGAYVTLAAGDMHYNADIYPSPDDWDPSRYMPEKAEDKKRLYGFIGWGQARHPCLGQRFAVLENNLIVAFFLAYFDELQLSDKQGNVQTRIPAVDRNRHTAHKPDENVYLKYKVRA